MQTYKFDADTKEYLYTEEAFLDPLESKAQGRDVWLLPADSTFTEPPVAEKGYAVRWNGTAWEQVEDHRQKRDKGGVVIAANSLGKIKTANQGTFTIENRDSNTPYIKKVRVVTSVTYYLKN